MPKRAKPAPKDASINLGATIEQFEREHHAEVQKKLEALLGGRAPCCQQAIRDAIEALKPRG